MRTRAEQLLRSVLVALVGLAFCVIGASAQFGRKKRQQAREEAAAAEAAAAMEKDSTVSGMLYFSSLILAVVVATMLVKFAIGGPTERIVVQPDAPASAPAPTPPASAKKDEKKKDLGNRPNAPVDVVIVGCGLPKRGMGWYHLIQLLEMPKVNLSAVVEPFFLNPKLCKDVPPAWTSFVKEVSAKGVKFAVSVEEAGKFTRPTICLIAGRTMDNPKLFSQCVMNGAQVIYLEKPGAPSVGELEQMKKLADDKNVTVYIGYNKNVTSYVQQAVDAYKKVPGSRVFFGHNNEYKEAELAECFTRNAEGMLKNMAVHELALLVTFFGVTVDTIKSFDVDKKGTIKRTFKRTDASGKDITDFSRVDFTITTKSNATVGVMADRCGGSLSYAEVNGSNGRAVGRYEFPTDAFAKKVEEQKKADPAMMPYFFLQSDDYLELKNRVVNSVVSGKKAEGLATLQIGIEALKLGDYITTMLNKAVPKATK